VHDQVIIILYAGREREREREDVESVVDNLPCRIRKMN
jgi:hypothetical protein